MFILSFFLTFSSTFAKSLSLSEVYQTALSNTEVMKRSQSRLEQAQEKKSQSVGAILPTVSLRGNFTKIDPPPAAPGQISRLTLTEQYSSAINVTQPVFRGMREYSVYRQNNTNILLNQYLKDSSKISLYQSVISGYFNLLISQQDLKNLKELEHYSRDRVAELRERVRIGRSRKGELLQAEAQLANTHAQLTDTEGMIEEAKAQLAFFLIEKNQLSEDLAVEELPQKIPDLDYYLGRSQDRPDLKARMAEIEMADEGISQSKGLHYPTVDVFGNYYLKRTGVLQDSKWDVGVTASMPLYQGGTTVSLVREAVDKKYEVSLTLEESKRAIQRDVSVLHESVTRAMKQLKELETALHKSEESYKENLKDYRYGSVTNLEVITALNAFVETKRSKDRIYYQTLMSFKNLEAQAGVLP